MIPLLLVPLERARKITYRFVGLFEKITIFYPGLKYDLRESKIDLTSGEYLASCFLSALLWGLFIFVPVAFAFTMQGIPLQGAMARASPTFITTLVLFLYYWVYPSILSRKKAQQAERHLVFALKNMFLQVSSGVSLFNSMVIVSESAHGSVSDEFGKAVREVRVGVSIEKALEKMALRTNSQFFKRTVWQLLSGYKSGASLKVVLRVIVDDLIRHQRDMVRSYSQELNTWVLIYMLFAVAAPTIGATLLVVLSSIAGGGVSAGTFILLVLGCFVIQIILIGFVKSRRPQVWM